MTKLNLECVKEEHRMYVTQRDQAQVNFQQLAGAIYALELLIKKLESSDVVDNVNTEIASNEQPKENEICQ
jgi:hypothetical protein